MSFYDQIGRPDWWLYHMTWGNRYAYYSEWQRLQAGTVKRYNWLRQRGYLFDGAARILY